MKKPILIIALLLLSFPVCAADRGYILFGQSNARGFGESLQLSVGLRYIPLNVDVWVNGKHLNSFLDVPYFGPEISLIRLLAKAYPDDRIVFVKYAVGNTSLYNWLPNWTEEGAALTDNVDKGDCYRALLKCVSRATEGREVKFYGSFMMQGERDADFQIAARNYTANLKRIIRALRRKYGPMPFVYGIINPPISRYPYCYDVIQSQIMLPTVNQDVYPISTHGLSKRDDDLHYDARGTYELGRRFARTYLRAAR